MKSFSFALDYSGVSKSKLWPFWSSQGVRISFFPACMTWKLREIVDICVVLDHPWNRRQFTTSPREEFLSSPGGLQLRKNHQILPLNVYYLISLIRIYCKSISRNIFQVSVFKILVFPHCASFSTFIHSGVFGEWIELSFLAFVHFMTKKLLRIFCCKTT